jgi:hypothetical protein
VDRGVVTLVAVAGETMIGGDMARGKEGRTSHVGYAGSAMVDGGVIGVASEFVNKARSQC